MRYLRTLICLGLAVGAANCDCKTPLTPTVAGKTLLSVTVTGKTSINVSETDPLKATANYSDGTKVDVTLTALWVIDNSPVCSIDNKGVLTGLAQGDCNASAIVSQVAGKLGVDIIGTTSGGGGGGPTTPTGPTNPTGPVTISSLAVTGTSPMNVGQSFPWTATATFSDGTTQDVTGAATWASAGPGIASVNAAGVVTGVAPGTTTISAVFNGKMGSAPVTVNAGGGPNNPTVLSLSVSGNNNLSVGQTSQLTATAHMSDGTTQNVTSASTWTSATPSSASVNATGFVTGVAQGSSLVTASFAGKSASTTITVTGSGATVLSLTVSGNNALTVGQTSQLTATAHMSDGTTQNVTNASAWTSATPGAAGVNSTGLVTGVAAGSSVVSASFGGKSGSTTVTVSAGNGPHGPVTSLAVSGNPTTLKIIQELLSQKTFESTQYHATATYQDGTTADVTSSASWSSATPSIATVGGSTGLVTAAAPGDSQITASFGGQSGSLGVHVKTLTGIRAVANVDLTGVDLLSFLNNAIHVQVFADYSDGSSEDITSASVFSADSPLLRIDTPGVITTTLTALDVLLNPNHIVNVTYHGFTAAVQIHVNAPVLQSLQLGTGDPTNLAAGTKLPALLGSFQGGLQSVLPTDTPGLSCSLTNGSGALTTVLSLLGINLSDVIHLVNGTLTIVNNTLFNTLLANPLLGGILPVNASCTLNGVLSNTLPIHVSAS